MERTVELVPFMEASISDLNQFDSINKQLKDLKIEKSINYKDVQESLKKQVETAKNKFTVAFVGEFKSGKSTIINSILNLTGDAALSNYETADTAKAVRLMYKTPDIKDEAHIVFKNNAYPDEWMSWNEAKKYTSQVEIDKRKADDPTLEDRVNQIDEVHYYIDNNFLSSFNILDLPGTGAGGHIEDHQAVTEEKIDLVEIVMWVVSTSNEPGAEAIANLSKFKNKIVPLINVWQFEREGIEGVLSLEELQDILNDRYSVYFSDSKEPIVYYAKEIAYAQENGEELKDEWGKGKLSEFFNTLQNTDTKELNKDRTSRIKNAISASLQKILKSLETVSIPLKEKQNEVAINTKDLNTKAIQLNQIKIAAKAKLKEEAGEKADEIIQYIVNITDSFIEDQMQPGNLSIFFKALGKKNRSALEEKLKKDYKDNYLDLSENSDWFPAILDSFKQDIQDLLISEYIKFNQDMDYTEMSSDLSGKALVKDSFISDMIQQSVFSAVSKILPMLGTIIVAVILVMVPGGAIIDNLAVALMGAFSLKQAVDPLTKNKESIKMRTRASIIMQKYVIKNKLHSIADEINTNCYNNIIDNLTVSKSEVGKQVSSISKCITSIESMKLNIETCLEQLPNLQ